MKTVKTAISIDKDLFNELNNLSHKMHISRSKLFSIAISEFMKKQKNILLLEQINKAWSKGLDLTEKKILGLAKQKARKSLDKW